MLNEKQIAIANKMYEARKAVVRMLGFDEFKKKANQFKQEFQAVRNKLGLTEIEATISLLENMQKNNVAGEEQLLVLAYCVEIMEPMNRNESA